MAIATLEVARSFKRKDPESYHRLVKKLYCETMGIEFKDEIFMYEENARKDSTGCLSVIMHQKLLEGQQPGNYEIMTEQRVGSLYQVIEYLGLNVNVAEEGVFRKAGSIKKQQELLERVERGEDLRLEDGHYNTHECASVLKTFLANLSEPLVTNACHQVHLDVASLPDEKMEQKVLCTQLLLELIPDQYYRLLKDLLYLLNGVAQREEENKMSSNNLGMMFCTHVLCPKSLSAEELSAKHAVSTKITTFMIEHPEKLFTIPERLLIEIQAFLSRRSSEGRLNLARRSNQGPGVECLIANTVFSFVDKEDASVSGQVETAVVTQLNLNIDILDIKKK